MEATMEAAGPTPTAVPLSGDPVLIGIAVAQTSNTALLGQEEVIGAQIAEEFFNYRGGINGRPIKLVFQDTAGDEAGAINAFNTLINNDKVVGIVGPTLSQQAFAADPIADKAGVPVIAPSNTAKGIPQIGRFVSRVSAPVAIVAPNAVDAALEINPNIKKVAVLFAQDDAFSKSETGTFQETVKAKNLELQPVQTFQKTDTDFTTQVTNVMADVPDLVIISGLASDGGNLVRQLRENGYTGLIIGGNGLNTANIFPVCKAACDGVIIAQAYSYAAEGEVNAAFRAAYKEKQQKEPPQFSAQGFTGVQVLVEALRSLDKKSPIKDMSLEDLRKALNDEVQAGTYQTPLGEISFTVVNNDKGEKAGGELNQKQFYVAQIKMDEGGETGKFIFIK
jgi:branched-chain amino acid transport system substrate-binding protein